MPEPLQVLASDLPVAVRNSSDGTLYEFGVIYEGAFISLVTRKRGGVDKWVAIAKEQAAQAPAAPAA